MLPRHVWRPARAALTSTGRVREED
jgi:hypothetical protein